jgi:ABC-type nickel/cobalt efflux system permease component RcnA
MFGLDETIADLGHGGGIVAALAIALLLGLRHATDPDHLTAVSTLVMSEDQRGPRRAGGLGLFWGLGHACTLFLVGLPIVLFDDYLPGWAQQGLEVAIGVVIVALAVRLLVRWRRGYFHVHVHTHGGAPHAHPHMHEGGRHARHPREHQHRHEHDLGRTPLASFGIGLVHGAGGSAGVGVLLVAAVPGTAEGVAALTVLALGTAMSMASVSAAFGYALGHGPMVRRFGLLAPGFGTLSLVFGVWYALGALQAVPYAF